MGSKYLSHSDRKKYHSLRVEKKNFSTIQYTVYMYSDCCVRGTNTWYVQQVKIDYNWNNVL